MRWGGYGLGAGGGGLLLLDTGTLRHMAEPEDMERRIAALEEQVHRLAARVEDNAQDAAAARVLARGADRDVSEFRTELRDFRQATTRSFNAAREDLTDLREVVDQGFTEMRGKLDAAASGQQQIVELLNRFAGPEDPQ
jgi:chromosome segregation ATPase